MKYIALLRGINVGGNKKIKMADLRDLLTENGFENVKTYIQSGNVVFEHSAKAASELVDKMMNIITEKYGFEVKVVIKTVAEIETITNRIPKSILQDIPHNRVFAMLLDAIPEKESTNKLLEIDFSPDAISIQNDVVYIVCPNGVSNSKLNNNFIEKQLKVSGTSRNYKTMAKLVEMTN
ncbi:MAG: DUF1697 domain-containing protein [Saprospiraceae bacterium]|nr:DUF1697 domain-containing protein [Saprospiraceae bacterium]